MAQNVPVTRRQASSVGKNTTPPNPKPDAAPGPLNIFYVSVPVHNPLVYERVTMTDSCTQLFTVFGIYLDLTAILLAGKRF